MDYLSFILTVLLVSLSGVLMPGPVFATAIAEGRKNRHAGLFIATGHAIIEVPIIIALFFIGAFQLNALVRGAIGIAGGMVLIYFAISSIKEGKEDAKKLRGVIAGIALSSLNPYFIMWWITVGLVLAIKATFFGFIGLVSLIFFHEICDFTWYEFVTLLSNKGAGFSKVEKLLSIVSFILMMFFGIYFLYDGIKVII
ncbi:MAG TPA: lysine transporter LysE [Thermoplasmatales archaeon]|nr:lysine transporter LysE [Thermoplasmatales archaeon]